MKSNFLLDDKFKLTAINKEGKFFKKVSRIEAKSEVYEIDLSLDVNFDIYPMELEKDYMIAIVKNNLEEQGFIQKIIKSILIEDFLNSALYDEYQYVMSGKTFKIAEGTKENKGKITITASFGGLLMNLIGNPQNLRPILNDMSIYLLIKSL